MGNVISRAELPHVVADLRRRQRTIVASNGCFDLLHVGHVRYLQAARRLGDALIVGVNADESVRRLKGPERPINTEADRAEVLAALACVDYAVIFGEDTASELLSEIRPDVYAKGGDYTLESLPEAAIVQQHGGRVALIPLVPGKSTSALQARLARK